jgi:hypothetical protein
MNVSLCGSNVDILLDFQLHSWYLVLLSSKRTCDFLTGLSNGTLYIDYEDASYFCPAMVRIKVELQIYQN